MDLPHWISENTKDTKSVIEFGSQFFDKLSYVSSGKKIGIEIWKPYIDNSTYHDCIKIHGNFLKYRDFIDKEDMDCAMMIDTLEHIDKDSAIQLLISLKNDFNKIMVCTPEGHHEQDYDPSGLGGDEYQTHRSTWYKEDFSNLGFQDIIVDDDFHAWVRLWGKYPNNNIGGIFAIWKKIE